MPRNPVKIWILFSFVTALIGGLWSQYDSTNGLAFVLAFGGWLSSLLAVGYYSTPSNSVFGKIAFGLVIVTVIGIAFKILHFTGADEIINRRSYLYLNNLCHYVVSEENSLTHPVFSFLWR